MSGFLCSEQVVLAPQHRERLLILLSAATRAKMDQQPVLALTQDPSFSAVMLETISALKCLLLTVLICSVNKVSVAFGADSLCFL